MINRMCPPPSGLICELLAFPDRTLIRNASPTFGWIFNSCEKDCCQEAYQVLVSSNLENINADRGDLWDTGRVASGNSINIRYEGEALQSDSSCFWKVRTWDPKGCVSPYSEVQTFKTGQLTKEHYTERYPLQKREVLPSRVVRKSSDCYFVDFGRAAFGTLRFEAKSPEDGLEVEIHLGEASDGENSVDRTPIGSVRYRKIGLVLRKGRHEYEARIPPDERNTRPGAIRMPEETGEVLPFRYCELVGCPVETAISSIRQIVVTHPFDDSASDFCCSDPILNDVWDFCKYSIKATSFCGVYVDGDRERIPYEADAYINQLGHYCVDREFTMARSSHEYLIQHPTWPTEWILHSVPMAWADYMHAGEKSSLERYYRDLQAKTLSALAREDGLISVHTGRVTEDLLASIHFKGELRDIVDWPQGDVLGLTGGYGETDGYEFVPVNTVVNAFHYRNLVLMERIALVLGKKEDAIQYADRAQRVKTTINEKLVDSRSGLYVDGEGTGHSSLHANMFPLAFGVVPEEKAGAVVDFVKGRGMACSVYGAQYLLEALFESGEDEYAISLLDSTGERSWAHMIYDLGSTITLEAWDAKYKPNLDWNHAWGAAPANIIPRYLLGVQPLEPGFGKIRIKPQPGNLEWASLDLPTIRGTIHVDLNQKRGAFFRLSVNIPANTTAEVWLPRLGTQGTFLAIDGTKTDARAEGAWFILPNVGSGGHNFEVCDRDSCG